MSTIAIAIASVAFGVLISADLDLMERSNAQTGPIQTTTSQRGAVTSVTIPSFADLAARVMPAVVSISTTEIVRNNNDRRRQFSDPFEFFFPDPRDRRRPNAPGDEDDERQQRSGGSGFIISPDGYILTNNHVVADASKVEVEYGADENGRGGRTVTAKIIGRDPATDLALLKIEAGQALPSVPLGDSDRIRRGDWAIAIGNPMQLDNTLTVGVISAKGRALGMSVETQSFENFIQTDAAINRGNSGGPLLNINGEVIGINTAIRGDAQGLGFATPVNTAKQLLPQLRGGKVTRGYLGMEIREVTDDIREAWSLTPSTTGALVNRVTAGKPAAKAGLQNGDIIVEVDGRPVRSNRELIDYISYQPVGSSIKVGYIRNGERRTTTARTAERPLDGTPDEEEEAATSAEPARDKLGMSVQELTPQLRQLYNHDDETRGVIVTDVKNVSAAGDANILRGDVITEVQGQRVNNMSDFRAIMEKARSGQKIRLYVTTPNRGGASITRYTIVTVP